MAIYTIGDLHLSLGANKKMDVFGGWENYVERLLENWNALVTNNDTVVLAGDLSWGMSLQEARADFALVDALPGRKLIIKGNHDYWWSTKNKMQAYFNEQGFTTLSILHNNAAPCEGVVLCGSRGWLFEKGQAHDKKMILREAARLELSLQAAGAYEGERIAFLHYPPLYAEETTPEIIEVLQRHRVKRCYYGHIHSDGCRWAFNGTCEGISFRLISADFLNFTPLRVPT